ncbi:MAG: hypothetical protein PHO89_10035 [Methylacidiphilaceae bacterium]|nr:hypothetical protein [Candidatus Methylacidiphilaceae bacterium]
MRAVLSPERKERELSQRSNSHPASGRAAPASPIEAALPAFAVALCLLCVLTLALLPWWKEHGRLAAPVPAPRTPSFPASLADDEPHSFARLRSDYARWSERVLRWLAEGDPELRRAKRLDPEVERKQLPPVEAARACLQRHLQKLVTIDGLEPIGYERAEEGVAIDYRAVVRSRINLYVVIASRASVPKDVPEPVQRVWPSLLLDCQLPPGYVHDSTYKFVLLKANEPLAIRWRVERAQVVNGQWKILLASPSLLEWNCGFVAAKLLALREGQPFALHLAGDRCLEPFRAAYWETLHAVAFDYNWHWASAPAEPPGFAEEARARLQRSEPRLFSSSGPILRLGTAPRLATRTLTLQGYGAETDWTKPILAPIRRLQPQDAESRFFQRYRDLAEGRNRWIDAFVLQRAQIEDQRGKAHLPR